MLRALFEKKPTCFDNIHGKVKLFGYGGRKLTNTTLTYSIDVATVQLIDATVADSTSC